MKETVAMLKPKGGSGSPLRGADAGERATALYIYCMLLVYPLFTGLHGYARVTDSKFWFFAGATGLWLLFLLLSGIRKREKPDCQGRQTAEKLITVYLALCIVSALLSPYRTKTFLGAGRYDGLLTTALCCFIFLGIAHYGKLRTGYVYAAALGASTNCIIAILQLFGKNPLWLFPGSYTFFDAGVSFSSVFLGTIGNADLFSAYLCLVLPLTAGRYLTAEKRPLVLAPAIVLMGLCLFASGVSGGVLALAACILIAAPFLITSSERLCRALEFSVLLCLAAFFATPLHVTMPAGGGAVSVPMRFSDRSFLFLFGAAVFVLLRLLTARKKFRSRPLRRFFTCLSVAVLVLGVAAVYFYAGSSGTVYELSQVMHGHIEDSYGSSRVRIWRRALALFREHPLFGGGPGTIVERLEVRFSRVVPETGETLKSFADNAHNVYLGILVNTGLLSLLAYLAAIAASLRKAARRDTESAAPLVAALLCFWVQDFFGLGLFLVAPLMWLLWGLLVKASVPE